MMTIQRNVGKLCEVRFRPPFTRDELATFTLGVRTIVTTIEESVAFCSDFRDVTSLDKDIADTLVWIMRRDNPKVLCNAVLLTPGDGAFSTFITQLLVDAGNPNRRMFTDTKAAEKFLRAVLMPAERERLVQFIGTG